MITNDLKNKNLGHYIENQQKPWEKDREVTTKGKEKRGRRRKRK